MKSTHFATKEYVWKSGIDKDPVFLETKELAREINLLIEGKALGADHIHDLFTGIEQQMTAGGQNRTLIGKGADAIGAVGAKIAGLGKWLKDTTIVQGVDDTWADIKNAAAAKLEKSPGGAAVLRNIDRYRQLVQKYPQTSKFFWNAAAVVGGLVSGGMAVPAILGAMKGIDALVQGKEFSSAVGQGLGQFGKTAGVMAAKNLAVNAAHAAQNIHNPFSPHTPPGPGPGPDVTHLRPDYHDPVYDPPGPNVTPPGPVNPPPIDLPQTVVAAKGDVLSKIAQANQTSVKALMQANPHITNPNALLPGTEINLPPVNSTTYMGGVGTSSNTAAGVASGKFTDIPTALAKQRAAMMHENILSAIGYTVYRLPLKEMVDKETTVRKWALNESLGRKRNRSVALSEDGINVVLYNIEQIHHKVLSEAFSDLPGEKPGKGNVMPHLAADPSGTYDTKHKGKVGGGIMDKIEGGLKRAGNWLSGKWKSATTKFDANRAKRRLQDAGIGNDSDAIAQWLVSDQKVPQEIVTSLYQQLNFPAPAGMSGGSEAGAAGGMGVGSAGSTASGVAGGMSDTGGATGGMSGGMSGGATGGMSGGASSPAEQKAAVKDFQADVDALIRDLMNMNNMQQPAYVKYIRDRLDQHFPAAASSGEVSAPREKSSSSSSADSTGSKSSAPPVKNKQPKQKQNKKQKSGGDAGVNIDTKSPASQGRTNPGDWAADARNARDTGASADDHKTPVDIKDVPKPGISGKVSPNRAGAPTPDEMEKFNKRVSDADSLRTGTNETRRVYGGKYVKESIDARMLKEFDFFINQKG